MSRPPIGPSFNATCAGRAYFINDPEPVFFGEWLSTLVARLGLPPHHPAAFDPDRGRASAAPWSSPGARRLGGEPPLTRSVAKNLGSPTGTIDEAVRDFGYAPPVKAADGFERTVEWFKPRVPRAS